MTLSNEEAKATINRIRRQLLIHSCLYYRMDASIWDDLTFDSVARELVRLQSEYPEVAKECDFNEDFEGWDATTGYHLKSLYDPWVLSRAQYILELHNKYEGKS